MKSDTRYILYVVIFIAFILKPWIFICTLAAFLVWKYCDYADNQKKDRIKTTSKETPQTKQDITEEPVKEPVTQEECVEEDLFSPQEQGDIPSDIAEGFLNKT